MGVGYWGLVLFFKTVIILLILLSIEYNFSLKSSIQLFDKYFKLCAINNCVSNSNADPTLICKKCEYSFKESLDAPSAILEGIDTAALLI